MNRYYFTVIILILPFFLLYNCAKDPTEPEIEGVQKTIDVLILGDDGTEDSLRTVLLDVGFKVDDAGPYYEYTGEDVEKYKVIIFLNGVEWVRVMSDSTQQKIREYVSGGGVLFSIEWISWSGATNQIINDMLPIVYGGSWSTGSEYYYKILSHSISEALPDTILLPSNWSFSNTIIDTSKEKNAQLIFKGSRSGAAIVIGNFDQGNTIHWNMGGHYAGTNIWTEEVKQLFINCVNYAISVAR